ncbi:dimethylarginine dimethylaminohydrolase family protein [Arenibaculum pallidiluteum]|uniref:dimethylarginine dimethylaminohydrolase family protein n=1 Tax=Arenibaculum pallidiluteum TaxID=2812559 RepID=UPI001A95C61B|nr:arginine deiminase family protein [Arenibaculum pallidiluteum]
MAWTVDSETGVLRDVLLCRPDDYAWIPTNSIARATLDSGVALDAGGVRRQYAEMVAALEEAGVRCHYLNREPGMPYQVYTRDSSQTTPWGPVLTQLYRPQRRGEYASVLEFYQREGGFWRMATAGTIEGGDIHVIRPGLLMVGWTGERTEQAAARQFAGWFEAQGWEARLVPFAEHFLHLDVLFCMVADGLAVACEDVLDDGVLAWLRERGIRLIPVSYKETMQMGCNVLALGAGRVVSPRHNRTLNERLRAEGLTVLDPELDLFTQGGGGVHCMTMPLRRDTP